MAIDDKERIHFRGRGPRGERKARKLNALVDMIQKAAPAKAGHVNVRVRQTEGGSVFSANARTSEGVSPVNPLSFKLPDLDVAEEPTLREAIEDRYIGNGTEEEPERMPRVGQILSGQNVLSGQWVFVTYLVLPSNVSIAPGVVETQKNIRASTAFEVAGKSFYAFAIDCSDTSIHEVESITSFPYLETKFRDFEILVKVELTVTQASQSASAQLTMTPSFSDSEVDYCELDAVITNPTTTNPNFTIKKTSTLKAFKPGTGDIGIDLMTTGTVNVISARARLWMDGYDYAHAVK